MSKTYVDWSMRNFKLNRLNSKNHKALQANCLEFIAECEQRFDIIFLDPPSFSNSKRMQGTLDIQRDHIELIQASMRLLNNTGELYFSNNRRDFKLSAQLSDEFQITDIRSSTIDEDFKRRQKIHHCWIFQHK